MESPTTPPPTTTTSATSRTVTGHLLGPADGTPAASPRPPLRRAVVALALVALAGCHATFRRHVPEITGVRAQAFVSRAPHVRLGRSYRNDLADVAVNTWQISQEARMERRLAEALDPDRVGRSLVAGFADALGAGPPFPYTGAPDADLTLQIEVRSLGLEVASIGARGVFDLDLRVRGYLSDGRRVYRARAGCSNAAGAPRDVSLAFGTVNNVAQIERMSDEEIRVAFDTVAEWCGWVVLRKLRRHAG